VQTLIEHDLIDEYRIFVHPLVLGAGKRLFRETSQPLRLRLMECTQTTTGVLLVTYQPESR
jgi:dihydrofolate reductase